MIWSRIDQKSCFKSILTAGMEPVVVELSKRGEELVTDLEAIREEVNRLGSDNVLAIMTCTRYLAMNLSFLFTPCLQLFCPKRSRRLTRGGSNLPRSEFLINCACALTQCFAELQSDCRYHKILFAIPQFNLPHLVNNAYGLQSSKCCHLINEAIRVGRLDLFVQVSISKEGPYESE